MTNEVSSESKSIEGISPATTTESYSTGKSDIEVKGNVDKDETDTKQSPIQSLEASTNGHSSGYAKKDNGIVLSSVTVAAESKSTDPIHKPDIVNTTLSSAAEPPPIDSTKASVTLSSIPATMPPDQMAKKRKLIHHPPRFVPQHNKTQSISQLLAEYPFFVRAVQNILTLLQSYGPLTAGQLEYNLPSFTTSSSTSTSGRRIPWHDLLQVLVGIGLLQVVEPPPTPPTLSSSSSSRPVTTTSTTALVAAVAAMTGDNDDSKETPIMTDNATTTTTTNDTATTPSAPSTSTATVLRDPSLSSQKSIAQADTATASSTDNQTAISANVGVLPTPSTTNTISSSSVVGVSPRPTQQINLRYCIHRGIPRADVINPIQILEQLSAAHTEIRRSRERHNLLRQALVTYSRQQPSSSSSSSETSQPLILPKQILKQLAVEYPEIMQDPVYLTALKNCHVDLAAVDRERRQEKVLIAEVQSTKADDKTSVADGTAPT